MGDAAAGPALRRTRAQHVVRIGIATACGLPLLTAIVLLAGRVGATARFVTWPVVAFTALASAVALVGLWFGLDRPWLLAGGIPPALFIAYVLPAAPFVVIAAVLVGLGVLAVWVRGVAAGVAMTIGALMTLFVVIQGPAVECHRSGASSGSGPWWLDDPSTSAGSGMSTAGGEVSGTTQIGAHRYSFACAGTRLIRFERTD